MKKMGTWKVRSMFKTRNAVITIKEIRRLNIYILGKGEMSWPGIERN